MRARQGRVLGWTPSLAAAADSPFAGLPVSSGTRTAVGDDWPVQSDSPCADEGVTR